VYTAHGFHFYKGARLANWMLFFPAEWMLAPVTDVLITINKEDYHLAKRIMKAKRIEYVPGIGIDTSRFRADPATYREKRRELGFRQEDFLLLTVAEMTKNKNHLTHLKALALLKDKEEFANMHYMIVGRGEEWPSLEETAKELGIADHVHFLGYRTDAPDLYRCADLFLFMPYREGLSVALMEAMGSGLPIVCTRIRGNTDLVEDGISGIFAENTPEAGAEAILKLYRDEALRSTCGKGAAEKVKLFDNENVHRLVKDIYLSV
jgi:glycosyltransferase EpsD